MGTSRAYEPNRRDGGPRGLIDAGVDIVTHGDVTGPKPIPQETIRKLVKRGVYVSVLPIRQRNLEALERHTPGDYAQSMRVAKTNGRNMSRAGVPLLVSTDAGIVYHSARAYKVDSRIGTLEVGKVADLLVLDRNPLEDARNCRSIHAVIKEGAIVDRQALPAVRLITRPRPTSN